MLELFDDIRIYLPKYLSEENQRNLYSELSLFPENIDKKFYSSLNQEKIIFQGDGFVDVLMADYCNQQFIKVKAILVSNTCDASEENARIFDPYLIFAPIFNLKKYEDRLLGIHDKERVMSHTRAIREQKATSFFYLPVLGSKLPEESFVRLDCIFSIPTMQLPITELVNNRLFTLSNYGFYLFLVKLSLHLTRVQEGVDRNNAE